MLRIYYAEDYDENERMCRCGELIDDLVYDLDGEALCLDCFKDRSKFTDTLTMKDALEYGEKHKETVEIELNGFLKFFYGKELEEIIDHLLTRDAEQYYKEFKDGASGAVDIITEYAFQDLEDWCDTKGV